MTLCFVGKIEKCLFRCRSVLVLLKVSTKSGSARVKPVEKGVQLRSDLVFMKIERVNFFFFRQIPKCESHFFLVPLVTYKVPSVSTTTPHRDLRRWTLDLEVRPLEVRSLEFLHSES